MFVSGRAGFSGMLAATAAGNPTPVHASILWVAQVVAHHPVGTDLTFGAVQLLIGALIALRRTTRVGLAASIPWSLLVWWFGEGAGGVLHGAASPLLGGPGAVLFYAVIAVVVWPPASSSTTGGVVEERLGTRGAAIAWTLLWWGLGSLCLLGAARNGASTSATISGLSSGEPRWLGSLDAWTSRQLLHHGWGVAVATATACMLVGLLIHGPTSARRAAVLGATVLSAAWWVAGQDLGGVLTGMGTDPNAGVPLVLLVLAFWPFRRVDPDVAAVYA
jgi:hypothetical protein